MCGSIRHRPFGCISLNLELVSNPSRSLRRLTRGGGAGSFDAVSLCFALVLARALPHPPHPPVAISGAAPALLVGWLDGRCGLSFIEFHVESICFCRRCAYSRSDRPANNPPTRKYDTQTQNSQHTHTPVSGSALHSLSNPLSLASPPPPPPPPPAADESAILVAAVAVADPLLALSVLLNRRCIHCRLLHVAASTDGTELNRNRRCVA